MNNLTITKSQNTETFIAVFDAIELLGLSNKELTMDQATAINRAFKNEVAKQLGFDSIEIE